MKITKIDQDIDLDIITKRKEKKYKESKMLDLKDDPYNFWAD